MERYKIVQGNKRTMIITYKLKNGKTYYIGNDKKHYLITDKTSCDEIKHKARLYSTKGAKTVVTKLWQKLSWVDNINDRIEWSSCMPIEFRKKISML